MTAESDLTLEIVEETPVELNLVDETPITIELKETGATGAKGDKGDDGDDGATGADGLSAYEIWLGLGNTGTEQDFIDSLMGGVADEEWDELNLDGLVIGAMGASQPYGLIPESIARMRYYRVGRTCAGVGVIAIPPTATYPDVDPFFPIQLLGFRASDLPFAPKIGDVIPEVGSNVPNVGDFSLINVNDAGTGEAVDGDGLAIGSVITNFGGSLAIPVFSFFHVSHTTATQLTNLVFEGNKVNFVGRSVVIYFKFSYECDEAEV